jgi:hypothetical protein
VAGHAMAHMHHASPFPSLSHNYSTLGSLSLLSLPNTTNNFSLGQILLSQASHPPPPINEEAATTLSLYKSPWPATPFLFSSHFSLSTPSSTPSHLSPTLHPRAADPPRLHDRAMAMETSQDAAPLLPRAPPLPESP